jgi:orotate phosphoribosyltransferase
MTTIKPAVDLAARGAVAARTEELFRASGALREGHFQLKSGRHGDAYVEKFAVLADPAATTELVSFWVAQVRGAATSGDAQGARPPVDLVAGPTTGGIILAHEVARQLGVRAVYAEREDGKSGRVFRRGFQLARGERVLVVDDIMTTGGSVQETIAAVRAAGGTVVATAVLVDRSGGAAQLGVPLHALWALDIPTYDADRCPLCAGGVPLTKPGTTPAEVAHA